MTEQLKVELFCLHCNKECPHTITYMAKYLREVKCEECGLHIEIDKLRIMEYYAEDFIERVLSKPHRITEEVKKGLTHFMKSLPVRIIKKPYRVSKEVVDIIKDSLRK